VATKEDNLIPFTERTESEKREIAIKGGIASGIARKEKATMRKTLEMMVEEIAKIDGNDDKLTYKQLATLGLIKGAMDGKADNYKTMLEVLGEIEQNNTTPDISINIIDNSKLEETMYKGDE
jgi:hypothetical protein